MAIPTLTVSPNAAAGAYARVQSGAQGAAGGAGSGFGATLERAIAGVVQDGRAADAASTAAVKGQANITDVVTAVSQAQLALQTTVAIRDRVVQAYQSIMNMPI